MDERTRELGNLSLQEYIAVLQGLIDGGVPASTPVQKWTPASGRVAAPAPVLAYTHTKPVLGGARQITHPKRFWDHRYDKTNEMGQPVIRV